MSIVVDRENLAEKLAEYPYGYLLTSADGAVKAVTVTATVRDGAVIIPTASRGSARNLAGNPTATLLCPPTAHHGYSLIVDGTAAVDGEGFRLDPATAVLHRPADHNDNPALGGDGVPHTHDSACGHDCRPV
ncbi:MAG: pyridoxamine 5'-phosphate oxidase family protein [Intrasporangiaceae bacterium]|nr:pyridoxamine 5'-phosphate oxidase family protein [Intrasporangiaceae bacterium]